MKNFIYIPPSTTEDGDRQGYWLNMATLTLISEEQGSLYVYVIGNCEPLYLEGQQATLFRNYLGGQTYHLNSEISDFEYFDQHTAPKAKTRGTIK